LGNLTSSLIPTCGEWIFDTDGLVFGGLVDGWGCWSSCRGCGGHVASEMWKGNAYCVRYIFDGFE
jgi:hypothetical protein